MSEINGEELNGKCTQLHRSKRTLSDTDIDFPQAKLCKIINGAALVTQKSNSNEENQDTSGTLPITKGELVSNNTADISTRAELVATAQVKSSSVAEHTVSFSTCKAGEVPAQVIADECNDYKENKFGSVSLSSTSILEVAVIKKPNKDEEKSFLLADDYFNQCMLCRKSTNGREPLLLGCLHTFCEKCLLVRKHFRISNSATMVIKAQRSGNFGHTKTASSPTLQVPEDFGLTSIPEDAFQSLSSLKQFIAENNYYLGNMVVKCQICECNTRAKVIARNHFTVQCKMQANKACTNDVDTTQSETFCTSCEEKIAAARFCEECNEYLCRECVNAHKRVKLTKEHTLKTADNMENLHQNKSESVSLNKYCLKHRHEILKLFCETCNILTCRDCQLESHRDHKYKFVQEAVDTQMKQLKNMRLRLNSKKTCLEQTAETITSKLDTLYNCRNKANNDIVLFHRQLQEQITTKCQFFLNKIGEVTNLRKNRLNAQLQATKKLNAAVDHCMRFIQYTTEEQNRFAMLDAKQMVMEYLSTVMNQKFTTNPVTSSDIVFVPDKDIMNLISVKLGSLFWGQPASLIKRSVVSSHFQNKSMNSKIWTPSTNVPGKLSSTTSTLQYRPQQNARMTTMGSQTTSPIQMSASLPRMPPPSILPHLAILNPTVHVVNKSHEISDKKVVYQPTNTNTFARQHAHQTSGQVDSLHYRQQQTSLSRIPSERLPCVHSQPVQVSARSKSGSLPVPDTSTSTSSWDSCFDTTARQTVDANKRKSECTFSPPPLFDLVDIVKIEENQNANFPVNEEKVDVEFDGILSPLVPLSNPDSKDTSVKSYTKENCSTISSSQNKEQMDRKYDPNEDWCAVCNNGGDLLCCDTCPKVFHFHCHVPEIVSSPPGLWQCMLCRDIDKLLEVDLKCSKRKRSSGLTGRELKLCEKLLLELYCHSLSSLFHLPVRSSVPNYYKVIKEPMDLSKIKKKLLNTNFNQYEKETEFLQDIQLMFTNCFLFNGENSEYGKMAKELQLYWIERATVRLPDHIKFLEQLMERQRKILDENEIKRPFCPKRIENKTSGKTSTSNDKVKNIPYEHDCLWKPDADEDEEDESSCGTPDMYNQDEFADESQPCTQKAQGEKRRKQCKSGIVHIK